jgi:hypothetical protein
VKGHSGDRLNDLVDQLAVAAAHGPFHRIDPVPTPAPTEGSSPTLF